MVVLVKVQEIINVDTCKELLTKGKIRTQDKNTIYDIYKNMKKYGYHTSNYHYGEDPLNTLNSCKRLQAKNASISKLDGRVRNYIMSDDYKELDIKNCAVSILLNIIENKREQFTNAEFNLIEQYYLNKEKYKEKYDDKAKFKVDYITSIYTLTSNLKKGDEQFKEFVPLFNREEFQTFVNLREKIVNMKQHKHHKKNAKMSNLDGSALSNIICEVEKDIMLCVKNFLEIKDIKYSSIIYDGIFIDIDCDIDMEELESYIKENLDLQIVFNVKEIEGTNIDELFVDFDYEVKKPVEEEKKDPITEVLEKFIEWGKNNNLIRIKDSNVVLRKHLIHEGINYAGEVVYFSVEETRRAFQEHIIIDNLFTNNLMQKKINIIELFLTSQTPSQDFPIFETDWKYFGYTDGVLDITTNTFIKKENFTDNILVRKYLGIKYSITEFSDSFMKILRDQDFTQETTNFLYILMGRLFYPIGALDNERYVLALIGATTSGKSTILEGIMSVIDSSKRCTIDTSGTSDNFILGGKNNKELLSCGEATTFIRKIGEENFKSMSAGEEVEINEKFKAKITERWTTPMVLCANDSLVVKDKSGAINGKRVINFTCSYTIKNADASIVRNVKETFKYSVGFLIDYYFRNKNNISASISEQLHEWNKEVEEEDDYFKQLMEIHEDDAYYQLMYKKGAKLNSKDLKDAWGKHWRFGLGLTTPVPKIGRYEQNYLRTLGIQYKKENTCKICLNKFTKIDCICTGEDHYRHKTSKDLYMNVILVPGKRNPDYTNQGQEDCEEVG